MTLDASPRLSQTKVTAWALFTGVVAILALAVVLALVTRLPDETSGTVLAVDGALYQRGSGKFGQMMGEMLRSMKKG